MTISNPPSLFPTTSSQDPLQDLDCSCSPYIEDTAQSLARDLGITRKLAKLL
jgi:hypothetical protein